MRCSRRHTWAWLPVSELQRTQRLKTWRQWRFLKHLSMSRLQDTWITSDKQFGGILLIYCFCMFETWSPFTSVVWEITAKINALIHYDSPLHVYVACYCFRCLRWISYWTTLYSVGLFKTQQCIMLYDAVYHKLFLKNHWINGIHWTERILKKRSIR